jgi:Tol biopolymer transport system component
MTRERFSDEALDQLITEWLDQRALGAGSDAVRDAVLARTTRVRPLPGWLLPERWLPMQRVIPLRAVPRLAPLLLLIALLLAAALAIVSTGSRPRLPDPFGLASNGQVAYLSNGQIHAANPDGSDPIQLTFGDRSAATPTWSRDGTRFAYELISPGHPDDPTGFGDIVVANADGTHPITIDVETKDPSPVGWSPDGRWLVYSKTVRPDYDQSFIAAADGSSPPVRIGNPETVNWSPIFSPDGTKILYFSGWDGNGIGVMNPDGSNWQILNETPFASIQSATWHSDSNRIVVSAATGEATDLWILHLDGAPEQHLRVPGRAETGPSWSPAGDRLAYLATGDGQSFLLYVADADGTNERLLPGTYSDSNPSWSPDGTRIAALNDFGSVVRLTLVDPDGRASPIVIEGDLPAASDAAMRTSPTTWQRIAP